jgi:cell division protein FtsL
VPEAPNCAWPKESRRRLTFLSLETKNIGEIYANRAMNSSDSGRNPLVVPSKDDSGYRNLAGPTIYNGASNSQDEFARQALTSRNKQVKKRKISPFNLMLILLGFAVAIVLYISNVIAVQQLVREIGVLRSQHQQILSEQEVLKAQINRMSSLERIRKMAEEDLGLKNPTETPRWIQIDADKVHDLEVQLAKDRSSSRKGQE